MATLVHVKTDEIIQATEQIRNTIEETSKLAEEVGGSLDANSEAYGQGDFKQQEMHNCIDEITRTISDNAQLLADNISRLREFAITLNQQG